MFIGHTIYSINHTYIHLELRWVEVTIQVNFFHAHTHSRLKPVATCCLTVLENQSTWTSIFRQKEPEMHNLGFKPRTVLLSDLNYTLSNIYVCWIIILNILLICVLGFLSWCSCQFYQRISHGCYYVPGIWTLSQVSSKPVTIVLENQLILLLTSKIIISGCWFYILMADAYWVVDTSELFLILRKSPSMILT